MKKQAGFFLTVFGAIAVLFLRLYAYSNWIDPLAHIYHETSFWRFLPELLAFLLAAAAIWLFAVPKDAEPLFYPAGRQICGGLAALVLFCGFLHNGADTLLHQELFRAAPFSLVSILYCLFFLLSLVGLMGMAVCLFSGKKDRIPVLFTLAPLPFLFIRFLSAYLSSFQTEYIAELPWQILMMASECVFFLFYARRSAGFQDRRTRWTDSFFAALTILMTVSSFVLQICLSFTSPDQIPSGQQPALLDGALLIAALTELGSITFGRSRRETENQTEEEDGVVLMDQHPIHF